MNKDLYNKIMCAITHNLNVCDECKKCGKTGAEARVNLFMQLQEEQKPMLTNVNKVINYEYTKKPYLIDTGVIDKHKYQIWWMGSYPTAYVLPLKSLTVDEVDECYCHGDITYTPEAGLLDRLQKEPYIGWDYAHSGDYKCWLTAPDKGKKWTFEEIIQEVKNVVEYLEFLEK